MIGASEFLDELIDEESSLIEKFVEEGFRGCLALMVLKTNLARALCKKMHEKIGTDKRYWSSNKWYDKELIGGWVYELRNLGVSDEKIYREILDSKERFFKDRGYSGEDSEEICNHHHSHLLYDYIATSLRGLVQSR